MQKLVVAALVAAFSLCLFGWAPAQVEEKPVPQAAPAPVVSANAHQFIQTLVKQVGNKDPRIRLAVREALVAMSAQAVPALKQAQETEVSAHVKAFVGRTLDRIQKITKRKKGPAARYSTSFSWGGFSMGGRGRDIDRIAAELNLTFEQMAKLEPLYKKYDKNVKELYAEMRESGGFSDKEAWKDLREEMKLMQEETQPALEEFLDEKQTKGAMRYLRQGAGLGGLPFMIGGDGSHIQILEGPGGKMGVTIKRVEKAEPGK